MEQGQGESKSSVQNTIGFPGHESEDINPPGIEARIKQARQAVNEWPGPLDGPLGYSET